MRSDMAKVVTERPRRGHGNPSKKWGRRLRRNEYDAEDHGPNRAPIARRNQYGWNAKEFSDLLGPLRRYLRKQVGRPWDKVWSEITRNLDSRSLSGQHIFDHIQWEVEQHVCFGQTAVCTTLAGRDSFRSAACTFTRLRDCFATRRVLARISRRPVLEGSSCLPKFGIDVSRAADIRRYRVDVTRVWERREAGWFIHSLPLRARAARSSDHPERWPRGPDLQHSSLRTRRNEAGEQERDSGRATFVGTRPLVSRLICDARPSVLQ